MSRQSYPKPSNISNSRLNKLGDKLRDGIISDDELIEIDGWRASHLYPMNTFRAMLHKRVRRVQKAGVAQRLKRMPTVRDKLIRMPETELSRLQDIGGLRVILPNISEVYKLNEYLHSSAQKHTLKKTRDYIKEPKADGYRGIHVVFKYHGTTITAQEYDGLLIEIQLRTSLQHSWATAVEIASLITGEKYKSGFGNEKWLDFFRIASKAIELLEYLDDGEEFIASPPFKPVELYDELLTIDSEEKITESLQAFSQAVRVIHSQKRGSDYYVIKIDPSQKQTTIYGFSGQNTSEAISLYNDLEKENVGTDIDQVLVTAGKLNELKRAYPNYFPDVSKFVSIIGIFREAHRLYQNDKMEYNKKYGSQSK